MVRAAALIGASLLAGPADACRLALVLAMDVSSSVDAAEDQLQRQGLASALIAPDVQAAFFISPDPVAIKIFEWSGRYNQANLIDWRLIETPTDLTALATVIAGSQRSHNDFPTAMGHALGHAATQFASAPACDTQTIDISGDGENNDGFGPQQAYAAFDMDGITVNGLVINAGEFEAETQLIAYYRNNVIKGPGAFLEIANGFADFKDAMRRKLIRELSAMVLGQMAGADQSEG